MPGTRSVYFSLESELVVMQFQKDTKHSFSKSVNLIVQKYNEKTDIINSEEYKTLQRTMLMYKDRMIQLQEENAKLKLMIAKVAPEIGVEIK